MDRRERARGGLIAVLLAGAGASAVVAAGLADPSRPPLVMSSPPPTAPAPGDGAAPEPDGAADGHHQPGELQPDGRFTGPGEEWPPQPRGATGVQELEFATEEAATTDTMVPPERPDQELLTVVGPLDTALADPAVTTALGSRYHLIAASDGEHVPGTAKGEQDPTASRVVFYSLTHDQTVEVLVVGGRVAGRTVRPAATFQPPLSEEEKFRAAELARAHWRAEGDDRAAALEAFAILDLAHDGSFHPSRVAYVSFHAALDARPELLTWVDLSSGTVIRAKVDR